MYPSQPAYGHLVVLFVSAGAVLLALGWWLFKRYRDDQGGFRHFALGPRGLLAYGGVVLMLLGAAACLVGACLPAILR